MPSTVSPKAVYAKETNQMGNSRAPKQTDFSYLTKHEYLEDVSVEKHEVGTTVVSQKDATDVKCTNREMRDVAVVMP